MHKEQKVNLYIGLHLMRMNLISELDKGTVVPLKFIYDKVYEGGLSSYLVNEYAGYDWTECNPDLDDYLAKEAPFYDYSDIKRKLGIGSNGLCFLLSLCIEAKEGVISELPFDDE